MGSINLSKSIYLLIIILFISSIFYLSSVQAESYYADISIDVDSSGFVTIDGITNHPDLLVKNSEIYTSKKQSYWLLNITKEDVFSDFIYILTLPEKSSINYIKSSGFISIEEDEGNLVVKGFGENESFSILVQYQTEKVSQYSLLEFDLVFVILLIMIIILIIMLVVFVFKEKNKVKKSGSNVYYFNGLNPRQKEIMNLLIDKKVPLTQTEIQKALNIPKAAVSRNIRRLEIKGLIEKEQIGMSNLIRIKKQ
jgi:uncharacterized membrane protein